MDHVKSVSKANAGKSLKEILKMAKKSYKKELLLLKKRLNVKNRVNHAKVKNLERKQNAEKAVKAVAAKDVANVVK